MVLVSGFGEQAEVTGTRFFVMHLFFRNALAHYNISVVHYKKNGHITRICGA